MLSKVWDEIIYPFPNFNGCTINVWGLIRYFTPHIMMDVIAYPCWLLKLNHVSESGPIETIDQNLHLVINNKYMSGSRRIISA